MEGGSGHVVGVVHPTEMGMAMAAVLERVAQKHPGKVKEVVVTLEEHDEAGKRRLQEAATKTLRTIPTLRDLCSQATLIISMCSPGEAMTIAKACISNGFKGVYCDMSAIGSPTSRQIGRIMHENACTYVDAAVLGDVTATGKAAQQQHKGGDASKAPATPPLVVLAGKETGDVEALFSLSSEVRVKVVGSRVGQASSMRMCHTAYTTAVPALLLNIAALATAENVAEPLGEEWGATQPQALAQLMQAVGESTTAATPQRAGEMKELAGALGYHDLADGFAQGAAGVYQRLSGLQEQAPTGVDVAGVARRLLGWDDLVAGGQQGVGRVESGSGSGKEGGASSSRPKVLCLHGWRTSASIMEYQFRDFPKDLQYVFVDSCHPASGPPHGVVAAYFEGPFFEWWDKGDDNAYAGVDKTLQYIRDINEKQGPFVGVAGFSQGAALAALLCALAQNDRANAPLPDIRFAILTSPFVPADPAFAHLFKDPIKLPTFISYGETDYIKDKCNACAKQFRHAHVHPHTGGHEVPTKWNGKRVIEALQLFVNEQLSEHNTTSATKNA